MGDFKPSPELKQRLPKPILKGIENHRFVDKITDQNQGVRDLRNHFSPLRRRFAGVISDIAFDYFLIKHWTQFSDLEFDQFVDSAYTGLSECYEYMPPRMSAIVEAIIEYRWLESYATLDGISQTIDRVSTRIRFDNNLAGGIAEVEQNYDKFEQVFLNLFEFLFEQVTTAKIEA